MTSPIRIMVLSVAAALALAAFTWPSASLEPRDVPVGVVAGAPSPPALASGGAFDVHRYDDEAQAREAITEREIYGAVSGDTLLVATGASPAVAALLRDASPGARVVDLAPGTENDPRAATLASLALPLTLIGIVTAILAVLTARTTSERLLTIAGGAIATGVLGALFTQTWLDAVPGSWLGIAGSVALAVAAIGAAVTGLAALLGRAGIGIGAATMMLVANPWSGVANAPELLPEPAGAIGQLLPTGAAGTLLRDVAYFDGAAAAGPFGVLAIWLVAGLLLLAGATLRRGERFAPAVPAAA